MISASNTDKTVYQNVATQVWLLNLGEKDDIDDYWEYNNIMPNAKWIR